MSSFAICYDSSRGAHEWPNRFNELLSLRGPEIFCSYWVNEPEGTFISYTFGLKRDD